MRSVPDMLACRNAPIAPEGDAGGFPLIELAVRECRFPVNEAKGRVLFCASEVEAADWRPGRSGGCYCAFHRAYLRRQPAVTEAA